MDGGEHEDVGGGVPLHQQSPYVRVVAQSMAESGAVVPDPFPGSQKVVH